MTMKKIWGSLDPFVEGDGKLGRTVANSDFLSAFLSEDPYDEYHFFLQNPSEAGFFKEWVTSCFPETSKRINIFQHVDLHRHLARQPYHVFHLSDCLSRQASLERFRNAFSCHLFPITGTTHSLSYNRFMPHFLSHLWEGVTPKDAIIATSKSAVAMLESVFSTLSEQYRYTGPKPELVTIPLGVSSDGAAKAPDADALHTVKQKLGFSSAEPVPLIFLCLGRLSVASKMDFLPMLSAFKRAEAQGLAPQSYCVVLAGAKEKEGAQVEALTHMAHYLGINLLTFFDPTDEEKDALYRLADVFLAPSDNVQETFGLTVIEAGSYGLPVIATDLDGYRDTVLHELTGLLVPTLAFAETPWSNITSSLWFDSQYHFLLAQQVSFDVEAMGNALSYLGTNAEARITLGEAARARVAKQYTWPVVIAAYVSLWERLAAIPIEDGHAQELTSKTHPMQFDYGTFFKGHFSRVLDENSIAQLAVKRTALGDMYYKQHPMAFPYAGLDFILNEEILRKILFITRKPSGVAQIIESISQEIEREHEHMFKNGAFSPLRAARVKTSLLWALKQDLITIVEGKLTI